MPGITSALRNFFKNIWSGIDTARRISVNLLFLVLVAALLFILFHDDSPKVADSTALVVAPKGRLVEQLTAKSVEQMINEARGAAPAETLLKDVIDAIAAGKNDDRVKALVLNLSEFDGAMMTKLHDVRDVIIDFKTSGKKVIATADEYEQDAYYLAAFADEILVHKMGAVILQGFGRYKMYHKDGIDRLGLDIHIFRVGEYKSAVEPLLRDDMSPEAKQANMEWLGDLWGVYLEDVAAARGKTVDQLTEYAFEFSRLIKETNANEETYSFQQIAFEEYLQTLDEDRFGSEAKGERIGVIVARGTILDGSHPPGTIGGDSTAALIRQARNDENIKAIVLRVDSGGGSAFASEVIRRELEQARTDGTPVVISMGSVAASGGFWISTSSDQIWAYPSTITGSIGIFGMFPTFQRPLAKYLGTRVDGVGTAPLSGVRLDRELPDGVGEAIQAMIDQGYREFLERVAASRGMSTDEVDRVARGRVWSGQDAFDLGLVDKLGALDDAITAAAEFAGLKGDYKVSYIEKELEFKDQVLRDLMARAIRLTGTEDSPETAMDEVLRRLRSSLEALGELNDPNHVYALSTLETD